MPEHVDSPDCGCWGCIEESILRLRAADALGLLAKERLRPDVVALGEQAPVEYSLIDQLQQCLTNSAGGANVGRSRPGLPYDVVASEMWTSLWLELRNDVMDQGGFAEPDTPQRHALAILELLPTVDATWLEQKTPSWEWWCQAIRAHVYPERKTPVDGRCPNPECGQDRWFSYDEDGDRVTDTALVLTWDSGRVSGMMCRCCFSSWDRGQLLELAHVLNENLGQILAGKAR
ncbi:MAG: hypothetical protein Q4A03_02500 [Rothia sp. (in: high G+C Gram-positive bacteria)]|uniref:hypothetical protein n=1 Tax=Rothia sp. (in: high G+C Gram-positive bacteria) TaxID=1885016 RepID=UPI0027037D2F|nr:hypothetical protein [Rothia sp. (in: high G+C Gram-positive bacteria)]